MAERVGDAYVRITADGSGMDESIRQMMDESEASVRDGGKNHGATYADEFDKQMEKGFKKNFGKSEKKMFKGINKALTKQLVKLDFAKEFFDDNDNWDKFLRRMDDEFGKAGVIAGKRLEKRFRDSADLGGLQGAIGQIGPAVRKAERDMEKSVIDGNKRTIRRLTTDYRELTGILTRLNKGEQDSGAHIKDLRNRLFNVTHAMQDFGLVTDTVRESLFDANRHLINAHPRLQKMAHGFDTLGDSMGRAFGKGSRNNFLNFMGSLVSGFTRIPGTIFRAVGSLVSFNRTIISVFKGFGSGIRGALASIGFLVSGAGQAVGAIGAAIGGLFFFVGPILSLFTLLAGSVAALAGSIGFALVGAIGAMTAVAFPAAAAIGVVAFALGGMSREARKAMSIKMKPVLDEFKKLRSATRKGLFGNIKQDAKQLAPVLKSLRPLFHDMGAAVHDMAEQMLDSMHSGGFKDFRDTMEKFLPNAIRKFGSITNNVFSAIGGILIAMVGPMNRVLNGMVKTTEQFAKWTHSAEGKNKITEFFNKGAESLKAFKGFLGGVARLLGTILSAGRETGDGLFGSMTDALNRWNTALKADGGKSIRGWFKDAGDFARKLGDIVVAIGKVWDALDTPGNRAAVINVFKGLTNVIQAFANFLSLIGPKMAAAVGTIGAAMFLLGGMARRIIAVRALLAGASVASAGATAATATSVGAGAAGIAATGAAAGRATPKLLGFAKAARLVSGGAGIGLLIASTQVGEEHLKGLMEVAGAAAVGFSVGGPIGAAVGGFAAILKGIIDRSGEAAKGLDVLAAAGKGVADSLKDTTRAGQLNTNALTAKALADSGMSKAAKTAGIDLTDLGLAYQGNADAIDRVRNSLKDFTGRQIASKASAEDFNKANEKVTTGFNSMVKSFKDGTDAGSLYKETLRGLNATVAPAAKLWQKLGISLRGLPKNVVTQIKTPGMIDSVRDVKALKETYDLTPTQVITTLAAKGIGDTVGEVKRVQKIMDLTPKEIITLLTMNGAVKNMDDVRKYGKALKLTPEQITTLMLLNGIERSKAEINDVVNDMKGMPKSVKIALQTEGFKPTLDNLLEVADQANLTPKKVSLLIHSVGSPDVIKNFETMQAAIKNLPHDVKVKLAAAGYPETINALLRVADTANATPAEIRVMVHALGSPQAVAQIDAIQASLRGIPKDIRTKLAADGYSESFSQISQMADAANLVPADVRTLVSAAGTPAAITQFDNLQASLRGIPPKVMTRLAADGFTETRPQIEQIADSMNLLPGVKNILLQAFGFDAAEGSVAKLIKGVKGIPRKAVIAMQGKNFEPTLEGVNKITAQLGLMPKVRHIILKALGISDVERDFTKVGNKADELGKKHPRPKVGMDDGEFKSKEGGVNAAITRMDARRVKIKVELDKAKFDAQHGGMDKSLDELMGRNKAKKIPVDVNTSKAIGKVATVASAIERLNRKKVDVKVSVNTGKVAGSLAKVTGQVRKLNTIKAKPKVDVNTKGVAGQINTVSKGIRGLAKIKAIAKVNMDVAAFTGKAKTVTASLRKIAATKTVPKVNLDPGAFTGKAATVMSKLREIAGMHPMPTVSLGGNALGEAHSIQAAINAIQGKTVTITVNTVKHGGPATATGGLFSSPEMRLIGEAGPEAVVPLNRSLSQVDPAVRWLSAIAQGLAPAPGGTGKTVNVGGITVVTPNSDSRAVAEQVMNRLTTAHY